MEVALYDIHTGKLVYIANTIREAAKYCGVSATYVSNILHGRGGGKHIKKQWKPMWAYSRIPDEIEPIGDVTGNRETVAVGQYSLDDELLREFKSITEAANSIRGAYPTAIWACIDGKQKTAYGYRWKRADKLDEYTRSRLKAKGVL